MRSFRLAVVPIENIARHTIREKFPFKEPSPFPRLITTTPAFFNVSMIIPLDAIITKLPL